ncbi:transposase [Acetobacterium carbinolicum]|uniref:transposase n=1 Tax=Acetobacterium carbinolicum TaxID=52690 RepID=UPI0039C9F062
MGRKPRVEFEGAIYHVIKRGNNRAYIFESREDKEEFLKCLEAANDEVAFNLLGYVIMDNHYHLIIETKEKPLQKIMQKVNNAYSKNYNKRHKRTDHVFGSRYKTLLVNDNRYLLTLLRYIYSNPVRAGIHKNIVAYSWSSDCFYRQNIKKLVHIDKILDMFSKNRVATIKEYQSFMNCKDPTQNDKDFYEKGLVIGEEDKHNVRHEADRSNKETLDEILKRVVANDEIFHLIEAGSRKRFLRGDKISYVKMVVEQGYTFNEIGRNIAISATAANRMV